MKEKGQNKIKRYIVRKYVWAIDAQAAIKKESTQSVDDVWVDEDWKKLQDEAKPPIGFAKGYGSTKKN